MAEAFAGTYIIRLNVDDWPESVTKNEFNATSIPVFYELDSEGSSTNRSIDGSAWGENTPGNMAPPLAEFFTHRQIIEPTESEPGPSFLGTLARVTKDSPILSAPRGRARRYSVAKAKAFLVITQSQPKWRVVLMKNGKSGYISANSVVLLPYQIRLGPARIRGIEAAKLAIQFRGTPYADHGNDLRVGLGNAEFVQQVKAATGVDLPAAPSQQIRLGSGIERLEQLLPGDRLYFIEDKTKAFTVGIFIGDKYMAICDKMSGKVIIGDVGEAKWRHTLFAARRDP